VLPLGNAKMDTIERMGVKIVKADRKRPSRNTWNPTSPFQTVILVCLVAALSYFAPRLEGVLILNPQTVWPLWPGCALLVSMLLMVPRRIWIVAIPVAFAAFLLYDLQAGVPLRSIVWFIAADTVQVLIAALFLSYFFDGVPRLNSVNALANFLDIVFSCSRRVLTNSPALTHLY
jgi:hypothetical protein